jgi:predicted RNase H-like HicB family nuclease
VLNIAIDREPDGRWLAEISELPGVMAYGETVSEAQSKVEVLALRVIADRIEHGEPVPFETSSLFIAA